MSSPTTSASSPSSATAPATATASSSTASSSAPEQARVHVNDTERDASAEFRQLREDVKGFRFEGVGNLRDISILDGRIRPGLIFRSGTPSQATPSDFIKLVLGIGLTTIVDLREHAEDSQDQGARSLLRVFSLAQHKHIEEIDHAATQDADAIVKRIFRDTKEKPKYVEESGCPADAESHPKKQQVAQQQKRASGTNSPTGHDPGSGQGSSPKTWRKSLRRLSSSSRLLRGKRHGDRGAEKVGDNTNDNGDNNRGDGSKEEGKGIGGHMVGEDSSGDADAEMATVDPEVLGEDALKDPTSPLAEFANEALSMERGDTEEAPELEERHKSLDAQIDEFIGTSEPLPRVKYYVPLAERKTMALALISAVSMRDRLKVAGQYLVGATIDKAKKQQAKMHMLKKFDKMGLFGLNKIILRYSQNVRMKSTGMGEGRGVGECVSV